MAVLPKSFLALAFVSILLLPPVAHSEEVTRESLFDPARHMRVSEVRPGMKGYGLSVFKGTKIERFDVEVMSVLRNFSTKSDVILVSLKGQNLEHTGSIAGMSGSPIYLKDDSGRERMVGAFAYGWPLMKDPVGGVQPIEYMLAIQPRKSAARPETTRPAKMPAVDARSSAGPIRWDVREALMLPGMTEAPAAYPFAGLNTMKLNPRLSADDGDAMKLRPLATPMMTGGLPSKLVDEMTPVLRAYGLVPLQSGVSGSSDAKGEPARLEPGSVLTVPLLGGDLEMTVVGTCTEVIGDRIFGFGHAFNNEGGVALPLGGGQINGVIANLMTSFKLGALTKTWGTLYADEAAGVAGTVGETPTTIPIEVRVKYSDGSEDRSYHFRSAWHPRFTPLLGAMAITSSVTGLHELPEYHTLDYDVTLEFANGEKLNLKNSLVNASMPEMFFDFGGPMIVAASNPFEQVSVKKVSGTVTVTPKARHATILWVNAPRLKFRPGETLKAFVSYRPFRAGDAILPVEFELPRDLPEGQYEFTISGWEQYMSDEQTAKPFRFTAESAKDVFGVLRELADFRRDALYMRLTRQPDGIAIGRIAMPNLPSSRREVLVGAGRSNTTPFVSSTTKVVPVEFLMDGAAQFEVVIDKNARVETGAGKPPAKHDTGSATPPAAKPEKSKVEPKAPELPGPSDSEPKP